MGGEVLVSLECGCCLLPFPCLIRGISIAGPVHHLITRVGGLNRAKMEGGAALHLGTIRNRHGEERSC